MLRKVLVINKQIGNEKQILGLLSLESKNTLRGTLKVFSPLEYDKLLIKIGENVLVFDEIKNHQNFDFETVFHELSLKIYAFLVDGENFVGVAKSDNCDIDEKIIFKDLNKNAQTISVQNSDEKNDSIMKGKTDLKEKIENTESFFEMIKPQFDVLFSQNEHFIDLENMIEGTEWVKVMFDKNGSDHYILGKIFDGDVITHIAYGTYAENQKEKPPQGLEQFCQFLPLDPQNELSSGYYVMYQDVITGENVIM